MKNTSLHKSLRALKDLPVEVSFAQVEQWVRQSNGQRRRKGRWLPLLLRQLFWNKN